MPERQILSKGQFNGLLRTGQILLPGDNISPDFRTAGHAENINRILDHMGDEDIEGIRLLLNIFALLPDFLIRFILWITLFDNLVPNFLATPFRQIQIGIKGLVYTLYYSDLTPQSTVHKEIGWNTEVFLKKESLNRL